MNWSGFVRSGYPSGQWRDRRRFRSPWRTVGTWKAEERLLCPVGWEALYLVGGNSYGWWRESNNAVHEFGQPITGASYPNLNYIVFRSSGIPSE